MSVNVGVSVFVRWTREAAAMERGGLSDEAIAAVCQEGAAITKVSCWRSVASHCQVVSGGGM